MAGHSCEEDKFEQAAAWCQICLDQGAKAAMCVLAEWQQGVVYIYICEYIYIYMYISKFRNPGRLTLEKGFNS